MALCDRLEAARAQREATRDRLTASTLARLKTPEPPASPDGDGSQESSFQSDARFALKVLPILTTRPDQITRLRHTILNLAVHGKLVSQYLNDEPASALMEKMRSGRSHAQSQQGIRVRGDTRVYDVQDQPFSVPSSWIWTRLGEVCFQITDGAHHTPVYQPTGIPFLSVKDVSSGKLRFDDTRFISEKAHEELARRCNPRRGDILLTKVGTTGIAVEIDTDRPFSIFVSLALLKFPTALINGRYLCHLINSPYVRAQSARDTQGIGNKNLVLRMIDQFVIPIPPLAEQHRIVAKVDELMSLCDQLEASLSRRDSTRSRLLNALLHEALSPQGRPLQEAA
jgi:type I restriction enzyme S subunit